MKRTVSVTMQDGKVWAWTSFGMEITIDAGQVFVHDYDMRKHDGASSCLVFVAAAGTWLAVASSLNNLQPSA